jgi:hypothetical protein
VSEAVTDFIKNAGLTTIAHFLLTGMLILIGLTLFFLARTRGAMAFFLAVGILPAVSGILAMSLKYRYSCFGMFAPADPEAIAAAHREAWIDLSLGIAAALVILFLRTWRRRMKAKRDG